MDGEPNPARKEQGGEQIPKAEPYAEARRIALRGAGIGFKSGSLPPPRQTDCRDAHEQEAAQGGHKGQDEIDHSGSSGAAWALADAPGMWRQHAEIKSVLPLAGGWWSKRDIEKGANLSFPFVLSLSKGCFFFAEVAEETVMPTDPIAEQAKGRVALWLDPTDLTWLSETCNCSDTTSEDQRDRCARIRFRANAALHKAGLKA